MIAVIVIEFVIHTMICGYMLLIENFLIIDPNFHAQWHTSITGADFTTERAFFHLVSGLYYFDRAVFEI